MPVTSNFDAAFAYVLVNEGVVYTQNGSGAGAGLDRGKDTKYGITLATLAAWRASQGSTKKVVGADVAALSMDEAGKIYRANYWSKVGGESLTDWAVATAIFDASVLTGVSWAAKGAQTVANSLGQSLTVDGLIGLKSVWAINSCPREAFILAFAARQQQYFVDIVQRDATQRVWLKNWVRRAAYYSDLVFAV